MSSFYKEDCRLWRSAIHAGSSEAHVPTRLTHNVAALFSHSDDTLVAWQQACAQAADALVDGGLLIRNLRAGGRKDKEQNKAES